MVEDGETVTPGTPLFEMEEGDAPAGGAPAPKKEAAPEPTPAPAAQAAPAAAAVPTEAPKEKGF